MKTFPYFSAGATTQAFSFLCSVCVSYLSISVDRFGRVKVLPMSLIINWIQTFLFENFDYHCRYWTLVPLLFSSCILQPPEALQAHGF